MARKRSRSPQRDTVNPFTKESYSTHFYELLEVRKQLPVYEALPKILKTIRKKQVVIIQGETGSGKTTQVPQALLQEYTKIACTQPRRVAAMSVAKRVAEECEVTLGEEVGYSIRFEEVSGEKTRLKYLTDGMLLREAMLDPLLSDYQVIVLDEAHERTLATDVLFGMLKEVLSQRKEIKLVVMSATLDAEKFQNYFEGAPLVTVPGRLFPVEVFFTQEAEEDYVSAAVRTVLQIHSFEEPGDILVFLTGEEEIENACTEIQRQVRRYGESIGKLSVIPLYSSLPPRQQQKIFEDPPPPNSKQIPGRKCIVSTNIAETSLTIEGIVYVVDCGLSKQKVYNPRLRVESLLVSPISKASAKQRTGRAGRTKPGKCYRLYTQETYQNELQETAHPEILRSNLAAVVLTLKVLGIHNLVNFDFMDPPSPETMMRALEELNFLEALDDEGELTQQGNLMAQFPLQPELAKVLVSSPKFKCSEDVLTLVAMLSSHNPFVRPKDCEQEADRAKSQFAHPESDHLTLISLYNAYCAAGKKPEWCNRNYINPRSMRAAGEVRAQLQGKMKSLGLPIVTKDKNKSESIRKCMVTGYFMQIAFRQKSSYYETLREKQVVALHPSSTLTTKPEWALYSEYVVTSKNYIRTVSSVKGEWMLELAPHYFQLEGFPDTQGKKHLLRLRKILSKKQHLLI